MHFFMNAVTTSEMTCIVSGGALNSTHSLTLTNADNNIWEFETIF